GPPALRLRALRRGVRIESADRHGYRQARDVGERRRRRRDGIRGRRRRVVRGLVRRLLDLGERVGHRLLEREHRAADANHRRGTPGDVAIRRGPRLAELSAVLRALIANENGASTHGHVQVLPRAVAVVERQIAVGRATHHVDSVRLAERELRALVASLDDRHSRRSIRTHRGHGLGHQRERKVARGRGHVASHRGLIHSQLEPDPADTDLVARADDARRMRRDPDFSDVRPVRAPLVDHGEVAALRPQAGMPVADARVGEAYVAPCPAPDDDALRSVERQARVAAVSVTSDDANDNRDGHAESDSRFVVRSSRVYALITWRSTQPTTRSATSRPRCRLSSWIPVGDVTFTSVSLPPMKSSPTKTSPSAASRGAMCATTARSPAVTSHASTRPPTWMFERTSSSRATRLMPPSTSPSSKSTRLSPARTATRYSCTIAWRGPSPVMW